MKFKQSFSVVRTNEEEIEEQLPSRGYSSACNLAREVKKANPNKGVYVLIEFDVEATDE